MESVYGRYFGSKAQLWVSSHNGLGRYAQWVFRYKYHLLSGYM